MRFTVDLLCPGVFFIVPGARCLLRSALVGNFYIVSLLEMGHQDVVPLCFSCLDQVVEQQIIEIERQNGAINALEREMLRLKTMYETAVEQRNLAGVQLIDRNDELCVLYEKSNIQETTLTVSTPLPYIAILIVSAVSHRSIDVLCIELVLHNGGPIDLTSVMGGPHSVGVAHRCMERLSEDGSYTGELVLC